MPADTVVLWLAIEDFPNKERDLPRSLLDLCREGLIINWCHDIKSYKKLIPSLRQYPDALIATADDDLEYADTWLEQLYAQYQKDLNVIWAYRSHCVLCEKENWLKALMGKGWQGAPLPYLSWQWSVSVDRPSYHIFPTAGGGVLYPPRCFHADVADEKLFMRLAPHGDDLWFWAMLVLNGRKMCTVSNNRAQLRYIENTQEVGLYHVNVSGGQNDVQLKSILERYPALIKILQIEEVGDQLAGRITKVMQRVKDWLFNRKTNNTDEQSH